MKHQYVMNAEDYCNKFVIKMPEYKTFKVNPDSIKSTNDLAKIIFAIIGDAVTVDLNNIPNDRKSILEEYFIKV